jgi:hypothetical protein
MWMMIFYVHWTMGAPDSRSDAAAGALTIKVVDDRSAFP